jgi:hypothetical protein
MVTATTTPTGRSTAEKGGLLAAALRAAARGWLVLVLWYLNPDSSCGCGNPACNRPGKHPLGRLVPHGVKNATTDAAIIRKWWAEVPHANLGIATGRASGIVVLDVDPRHGGDESLARYEVRYGRLPDTPQSLTGGGGVHYVLAHLGGIVPNRVGVAPGLDIRGEGGLFVAPPSLHVSGRRYCWDAGAHPRDLAPAPAPDWLLELIRGRHRQQMTPTRLGGAIHEGRRNSTLARVAGALRRLGIEADDIADMLQVFNARRCVPPLAEGEVERIACSVGRYAPTGGFRLVEVEP